MQSASVATVTRDAEEPKPPLIVRIETEQGPYVVLNGESLTVNGSGSVVLMSGSSIGADNLHSRPAPRRDTVKPTGDRIWFIHDGRAYTISDPKTVEYAKSLFRPMEELGRKQGEIGAQQEQLRSQQGELQRRQSESGSDSDEESAWEQMQTAKSLALAVKQIVASEEQIATAKQQMRFAAKQGRLAQEQAKAAKHAIEEVRQIIVNSLRNGLATPD